jgi:hypothetical protein
MEDFHKLKQLFEHYKNHIRLPRKERADTCKAYGISTSAIGGYFIAYKNDPINWPDVPEKYSARKRGLKKQAHSTIVPLFPANEVQEESNENSRGIDHTMTAEKFIVVQEVKNRGQYNYDTEMEFLDSEKDVIGHIGRISSGASDDGIKIERIFKINEYGKVTSYSVVFINGRFQLEVNPEVKQG